MTVALGLTSAGAPWRVRRMLELCRPYVDEIVLVAPPEVLDHCATGLVDHALGCSAGGVAAGARMRDACGSDWLLCCEDGDVPGLALLRALRTLAGERTLTHYRLARRWLYGGSSAYLACAPWRPDYEGQLVRVGAAAPGESRLLEAALYRGELLLAGEQERRRRALARERAEPEALRAGAPRAAVLVPEDWEGTELAAVPAPDRAWVAYVLDEAVGPPPTVRASGAAPPSAPPAAEATTGEAQVTLVDPAAKATTGEARVTLVDPPARIAARVVRELEVRVVNGGERAWPWRPGDGSPLRLGYRWHAEGHAEEGPRTLFTETVEPGAETLALLSVHAPVRAGRYVLEVDVVEERVRWLGCGARLEVEVSDHPAPVAVERRNSYRRQARAAGIAPRHARRLYRRWAASLCADATPLRDRRPWLTFSAIDAVGRAIGPDSRVCEYGAGGSTLFALERGAEVVTIDWDADWSRRVGAAISLQHRAAWTLELVPPQADGRAAALDPSDPAAYVSASPAFVNFAFDAYAATIDRFEDGAFELVLVAGRARPSCVRHALAKVAPGGLLVLDHSERPWYEPALALAPAASWARTDHRGPGPYAERFWQTTILRRTS